MDGWIVVIVYITVHSLDPITILVAELQGCLTHNVSSWKSSKQIMVIFCNHVIITWQIYLLSLCGPQVSLTEGNQSGKYSRRAGRGETGNLICISTLLIYHCKLAAGGEPEQAYHCVTAVNRHKGTHINLSACICEHFGCSTESRLILKPHLLDNNATWDVWTYYTKWISMMCCVYKTRCCSLCAFLPESHIWPWHPPP